MYDIIVIGAGASGLLASCTAARSGSKVLLLERNEKVGRKLFITGKGRCNLTNNCSVEEALDNIPTGKKFLYSAFNRFSPSDTISLFEHLGVALKTERGGRVFPVSDKSSDIIDALKKYVRSSGVMLKSAYVAGVKKRGDGYFDVSTIEGVVSAGAVILATGGKSYPATGSTGDGYVFAKELGHSITDLRASLVPLSSKNTSCSMMQGLALKNVKISVYDGGTKPIFSDFGEILFTHFGLSGPLALTASAHMRDFDNKSYKILIDLKPALDEKKLDLRILRDFEKFKSRSFSNSLGELFNRSMIPVIIDKSGIPGDKKVHSVTRDERLALISLIKAFPIDIEGPRPIEDAIITSGGVSLNEINPKTMESKLVKSLYFAGEIIDADAYTGGFNLQIAWSTGYAAGLAAASN